METLTSKKDEPPVIAVQGQDVVVVEEFVYLGALIHSSTDSSPDVIKPLSVQPRRSGCHAPYLQCNGYEVLLIFMYRSECWAITKEDARKIDALDERCLYRGWSVSSVTSLSPMHKFVGGPVSLSPQRSNPRI